MNFRSWLRKIPAPVTVLVGATKLRVVESRTKWADLETSLLATARDGDTIAALDAEGNVLRSVIYDGERVEEEEEEPKGNANEANADFMVLLAREISNAHDAGAKRHADAYSLAFNKMAEIVTLVIGRVSSLENMWAKSQIQQARAQAELLLAQAETQEAQKEQGGMLQSVMPLLEGVAERLATKAPELPPPPPPPPPPQTTPKGKK